MDNEQIIKELTETAARSKSNTKRLDAMEKRQDDLESLTQAVAVMKSEAEHTASDVKEIKVDVKALKERPVKWWETLVVALIGGLAGFALKAFLGV